MTILMIMQIEIIEHAQLNGNPNTPPLSATEAVFWIWISITLCTRPTQCKIVATADAQMERSRYLPP